MSPTFVDTSPSISCRPACRSLQPGQGLALRACRSATRSALEQAGETGDPLAMRSRGGCGRASLGTAFDPSRTSGRSACRHASCLLGWWRDFPRTAHALGLPRGLVRWSRCPHLRQPLLPADVGFGLSEEAGTSGLQAKNARRLRSVCWRSRRRLCGRRDRRISWRLGLSRVPFPALSGHPECPLVGGHADVGFRAGTQRPHSTPSSHRHLPRTRLACRERLVPTQRIEPPGLRFR